MALRFSAIFLPGRWGAHEPEDPGTRRVALPGRRGRRPPWQKARPPWRKSKKPLICILLNYTYFIPVICNINEFIVIFFHITELVKSYKFINLQVVWIAYFGFISL